MYKVVKRDGELVEFNINKISAALTKAFESTGKNYHPSIIDMLALKVTSDFEPKVLWKNEVDWSTVIELDFHLVAILHKIFSIANHVEWNYDVGGKELAIGDEVCKIAVDFQRTYKHLFLVFDYACNDRFGFVVAASCADMYFHLIAIECMHRVAFGNKDTFSIGVVVEDNRIFSVTTAAECTN